MSRILMLALSLTVAGSSSLSAQARNITVNRFRLTDQQVKAFEQRA